MEGLFEGIDSTLYTINETIERLCPEEEPILNLQKIYDYGIFPSIVKAGEIANASRAIEFNHRVLFIRAVTLPTSHEPVSIDYGVLVEPQQWKLLQIAHHLELTHWFKKKEWVHHFTKTAKSEHGSAFVKLEKVYEKECTSDNEVEIEFVVCLRFGYDFYFGPRWCYAAKQHFEDASVRSVGECSREHIKCEKCHKDLVCHKHEAWLEKTVCECINDI